MTDDRYGALMTDDASRLTSEEVAEGWHWCLDCAELLVGPEMDEWELCGCRPRSDPEPVEWPSR